MPIDCDDKLLSDLSSPPVLFPPFAQSHPISFVRSTVADNLLNSNHRRVSDRIQAYALFTDPPLGRCKLNIAIIVNGNAGLRYGRAGGEIWQYLSDATPDGLVATSI